MEGWGGPARHGLPNGHPDKPRGGRPKGVKNGEGKRTVAQLLAERGAQAVVVDRWMAILNDPAHPQHASMIEKAATRMDGAPVARMEHAFRDVPAEELTDDELAAYIRQGSGGAAGATEGAE